MLPQISPTNKVEDTFYDYSFFNLQKTKRVDSSVGFSVLNERSNTKFQWNTMISNIICWFVWQINRLIKEQKPDEGCSWNCYLNLNKCLMFDLLTQRWTLAVISLYTFQMSAGNTSSISVANHHNHPTVNKTKTLLKVNQSLYLHTNQHLS